MADLRDMELLAALARNRHFARAAAECGISQPAFSARIRNLETDLGAPIVKRGNRFMGFTDEGEIAIRWAQRLIADARGLRQEIEQARGELSGKLTIGAVPTALTFTAMVASELRKDHPALTIQVLSQSSVDIAQGLEDFSLDAGITYLQSTLPAESRARQVYVERYELLIPKALDSRQRHEISWEDAAQFPLCLLSPNMRNRRIIDSTFQSIGVAPNLVMETNAFSAAMVQVVSGAAAAIAPETLAANLFADADIRRLRLINPIVEEPIGVVISDHEPRLPAVDALMAWLETKQR